MMVPVIRTKTMILIMMKMLMIIDDMMSLMRVVGCDGHQLRKASRRFLQYHLVMPCWSRLKRWVRTFFTLAMLKVTTSIRSI